MYAIRQCAPQKHAKTIECSLLVKKVIQTLMFLLILLYK